MKLDKYIIHYKASKPGCHIITDLITSELKKSSIKDGILHLFIHHTSASLTISENHEASVRDDLEAYFNHQVKENEHYYTHLTEGPDDMPAHIKNVLIGSQVSIPFAEGKLSLGTWQGIFLWEFRNACPNRKITLTLMGQ